MNDSIIAPRLLVAKCIVALDAYLEKEVYSKGNYNPWQIVSAIGKKDIKVTVEIGTNGDPGLIHFSWKGWKIAVSEDVFASPLSNEDHILSFDEAVDIVQMDRIDRIISEEEMLASFREGSDKPFIDNSALFLPIPEKQAYIPTQADLDMVSGKRDPNSYWV